MQTGHSKFALSTYRVLAPMHPAPPITVAMHINAPQRMHIAEDAGSQGSEQKKQNLTPNLLKALK
jgi:hypothetical protein